MDADPHSVAKEGFLSRRLRSQGTLRLREMQTSSHLPPVGVTPFAHHVSMNAHNVRWISSAALQPVQTSDRLVTAKKQGSREGPELATDLLWMAC
jgi:hypothetical protein